MSQFIKNKLDLDNMDVKRIALIGYSPVSYFQSFGQALESAGFEVYWAHITRSATINHTNMLFTTSTKILDTTANFRPDLSDVEKCKRELAEYEFEAGPRINDIILMDRILRNKSNGFALCYLNHLQHVLSKFFIKIY